MAQEVHDADPAVVLHDLPAALELIERGGDLLLRQPRVHRRATRREFIDATRRGQGIGEKVEEQQLLARTQPDDVGIVPEAGVHIPVFVHARWLLMPARLVPRGGGPAGARAPGASAPERDAARAVEVRTR